MKRLGIVKDISYRGTLVIRAERAPKLGEEVFTREGMHIGRVEKVYGPISRPYISMKPTSRNKKLMGTIGKEVYVK